MKVKYRHLFAVLTFSLILASVTIPQVSPLQTWETWSPDFSSQGVILTEAFEGYLYDPDIVHGGTLTVATPSDPPEQHQWNAGASASYDFLSPMGDYLTRTDPVSGGVVPWIAESWEISEDKLSYVVHLTSGVKFHDGTELTSADVKWCFDFIMENNFIGMSNVWQILSRVNPTEIIDDYTLRFHLAAPYVSFPSKTLGNTYIYPKHIWEEIVARPGFDWLTYVPTLAEQVGCGPFKLVEYVPNSHYKFEAFEDYWHGRPYVDYFIRPIITSGDAELLALKRGEVDIFTGFLASEAIPSLLREEGIGLYLYNNPYMYHWGMNNYKWPFNVKEFRFALAHAIDKQYIVDKLLLGYGLPGTCGVEAPFYDFWFNPNVPATYYFDLDKAAQILDDLGWVDTDGDGVREGTGDHAGEPLAFDIGPPIYDPVRCRAAELLSEWFSQIGVNATVVYMEWATLWDKISEPLDSPNKIDTWLLGSSQGVDPSWMHIRLHSYNIPNPNYYGFMNAEYDELALLQGTQFDSTERQASIWRMQEILAEEVPLVVLYFRQSLSVYRTDNLTGWIKHFGAGMDHFWNYINVHIPMQPSTTYEIVLFEGWNLIGLPCTPEDPSIEVVLADILENVRSVWAFDGEMKTWSSYAPEAPSDLTEIIEYQGYWINMDNADILTVYGGCTGTVVVEVHPLDGQTIRIGMTSASTEGMENTVILAEEIIEPKINEYVSSLGYDITFEFLVECNEDQWEIALEKTQYFKSIGIDLIIGHGWSSQCQGSLDWVNENDMLLLSGSSTSPNLAIPDDRLFRTCPNDNVQGIAIAEMWETWGAEAVLIFHRDDAWGDGIYNILTEELPDRGIDEIGHIRYPGNTTDFSGYLQSANDTITAAITEYGVERVGIQFMSFAELRNITIQAAEYDNLIDIIWMGTENNGRDEAMLDQAGEWAVQTRHFSSAMRVDEDSFLYQEFAELYYDLTDLHASFYTATQYDAAWLLVETILKTASTDPSVIAEVLIPTSYMMYGVSGWMALDENGDRIPQIFDIWGLYEDPNTHEYIFGKFGTYDAPAMEVYWDDGFLEYTGITRPGK